MGTSRGSIAESTLADAAAYLAPTMRATSALARARDRAAFTFWGWLSGTTPLPMAVARKGMPVASTNLRS